MHSCTLRRITTKLLVDLETMSHSNPLVSPTQVHLKSWFLKFKVSWQSHISYRSPSPYNSKILTMIVMPRPNCGSILLNHLTTSLIGCIIIIYLFIFNFQLVLRHESFFLHLSTSEAQLPLKTLMSFTNQFKYTCFKLLWS